MENTEQWVDAFGFSGLYQVSDMGRIRSIGRRGAKPGRIRRVTEKPSGYLEVILCKDNKNFYRSVHRLVLQSFVGEAPEGKQCCHGNGIHADNRLSNLRWGTPLENSADKKIHGTWAHGVSSGNAKINDVDVERMRDLKSAGVPYRDIAKWLGIGLSNVKNVLCGLSWRHVPVSG